MHTKKSRLHRWLLIASAIVALPASAATFCVGDTAALESALQAAQANGEDDVIRIAPGTYTPTGTRFQYSSAENHTLEIGGGFDTDAGLPPCSLQRHGAQWTHLDGAGSKVLLEVSMSGSSGSVHVHDLTVENGASVDFSPPLHIAGPAGWGGDVSLDNVLVRNNTTGFVIANIGSEGIVSVRNSAFIDNVSIGGTGVILALLSNHAGSGTGVVLENVTVARNSVPPTSTRAGISIFTASASVAIVNSIVWNNGGTDLNLGQSGEAGLDHDDIGSLFGGGVAQSVVTSPFHVDPMFANAIDAQLNPDSPLRDVGLDSISEDLGLYDVVGAPRTVFDLIDVGAYELQDGIFTDGFDAAVPGP